MGSIPFLIDKMKKTLVLGASSNPNRYSYKAIQRLRAAGHEVHAVGSRQDQVADISISDIFPNTIEDIHTIALYLRPNLQDQYYRSIVESKAKRIIFNPGTENSELTKLANEHGIETINACTLVMLSINDF